MRGPTGYFATTTYVGETVRAFVPHPLPPSPPIIWDNLHAPSQKATHALGRLDGVTTLLPMETVALVAC